MKYRTPEALGMADTTAARKSGMDVGHAISGFYFHRLLIEVEEVPVFDYKVYPIANSIADKLCGIIVERKRFMCCSRDLGEIALNHALLARAWQMGDTPASCAQRPHALRGMSPICHARFGVSDV